MARPLLAAASTAPRVRKTRRVACISATDFRMAHFVTGLIAYDADARVCLYVMAGWAVALGIGWAVLKNRNPEVTQRRDDGVAGNGDAFALREAQRHHAAPGLHQHRVGVPVVAARELEQQRAPGVRAREADGRHHRFRAAHHEAHAIRRREGLQHQLGQRGLEAMTGAERQPVARGLRHRLDDARVRMPEDQRPPRHAEVEVRAAVFVDHRRALAARHVPRRPSDGAESAHRARHASGDEVLRLREEFFRGARRGGHFGSPEVRW